MVAVRLGMPLSSASIRLRRGHPIEGWNVPPEVVLVSAGYTTLVDGVVERWLAQLPDGAARANLEALAVQQAAGIVAELDAGKGINDLAHRDDMFQMVQLGGALGYGKSSTDQAMKSWLKAAFRRAAAILAADGGIAWDRVTMALLRKRELSGDEVKGLVAGDQERPPA